MLFPSRLTETPGLEKPTQYWMIWLIGESPYYRSDSTRLLVALIMVVLKAGTGAPHRPRGLDIVEFPLNVNGKSCSAES
jgi:hypothetical protein